MAHAGSDFVALLQSKLIAPWALRWLASASDPRIHSIYKQSVNLIDPQRGLLSVVRQSLGPGPFAIVAEPVEDRFEGFQSLELQSQIVICENQIQIGDIQILLADSHEWQPRPDWERLGVSLDEAQVSRIKSLLLEHAPPDSFAPLADGLEPGPDNSIQSKALRAAMEPAMRLRTSLVEGNLAETKEAAARLAGLGGGVTPSGDDYLQGTIHAAWSKLPEEKAETLGNAIAYAAVPRTNAISGEWLKAAARGEAGEDWHLLERSLDLDRELDQTVIRLIHRGHTSGADALAGFVAVLSMFG